VTVEDIVRPEASVEALIVYLVEVYPVDPVPYPVPYDRDPDASLLPSLGASLPIPEAFVEADDSVIDPAYPAYPPPG
jgi:hypothetical protein